MYKPKLNTAQQIEHLKKKGVQFTIVSESDALKYLSENNNFFKLTAYRKNYPKNRDGKYVNLEFAYLQDLAIMDMRIRKCLLNMCLDVEHNARMRIIHAIEQSDDDGYQIVRRFRTEYPILADSALENAQKSIYCRDLMKSYKDDLPIWVFVEVQQFGCLCTLFRFVADFTHDKNMINDYYLLQEIRKLRNACAHSNCILNDLQSVENPSFKPNYEVSNALMRIKNMTTDTRRRKTSNERIRQISTLLYYYHAHIKSSGLKKYQHEQLVETFISRPSRHADYYRSTEQVSTFFAYMQKLIDNWFPAEV